MVPLGGGPLVPYSLTPMPLKPPMPILITGPDGLPKVMMSPPGGGPLVPYEWPPKPPAPATPPVPTPAPSHPP